MAQVRASVDRDALDRTDASASWLGEGLSPELNKLMHIVHVFLGSQRRLLWRSPRTGAASPDRVRALVQLSLGETTHGELVREVDMNPARVSALVEDLESQGLVRRRQDERDGRVWWLSLTPSGRAQVDKIHVRWAELMEDAFDGITTRDLRSASRVLERLTGLFDAL